ncbi:hypothetical protein D3C81_1837640 [compost metagenome]
MFIQVKSSVTHNGCVRWLKRSSWLIGWVWTFLESVSIIVKIMLLHPLQWY